MKTEARLLLLVGLRAMISSVARNLVSIGLLHLLGPGFGWGTLTVNVLGSLLIGLYATLTEPDGRIFVSPARRQFVLAGFCGGFPYNTWPAAPRLSQSPYCMPKHSP